MAVWGLVPGYSHRVRALLQESRVTSGDGFRHIVPVYCRDGVLLAAAPALVRCSNKRNRHAYQGSDTDDSKCGDSHRNHQVNTEGCTKYCYTDFRSQKKG